MTKARVDIFYREVSHGHETCPASEAKFYIPQGTTVRISGPSKVPGHVVVMHDGRYVRVRDGQLI